MSTIQAEAPVTWDAIRKGRREKPDRIFYYAVEKFGKTAFGAGAPKPVFLDFEDGTCEFDNIESFDMRGADEQKILGALDYIKTTPNGYRSIVIDTVGSMADGIKNAIVRDAGVGGIEDVDDGYGKGYTRLAEAIDRIFRKLDDLREAGFHAISLCHATTATFENPAGANFTRYEPFLDKKCRSIPKEWADAILFGIFEDSVVNTDRKKVKGKGVGGRRRVVHTVRTAAWDAGNRYGLPARLVLTDDPSESYGVYAKARQAGQAAVSDMMAEINALLPKIELEEERKSIAAWVESKKDNPKAVLAGLNRLREKVENLKPKEVKP